MINDGERPEKTIETGMCLRLGAAGVAAVVGIVLALVGPAGASAGTVYAAALLRGAFPAIDRGQTYNFAGSNQLLTQIQRGAPADVFASASPREAQALFRAGRCERPVTFATNAVVLITPRRDMSLRSVYDLRRGGRRLAIGAPGVPIGAYTRLLLGAYG